MDMNARGRAGFGPGDGTCVRIVLWCVRRVLCTRVFAWSGLRARAHACVCVHVCMCGRLRVCVCACVRVCVSIRARSLVCMCFVVPMMSRPVPVESTTTVPDMPESEPW